MTFDEVIEEHRVLLGAKKVHVSLGPDATPERLREDLERLRLEREEWMSFPETLRLKAEIAQLEDRLSRISRLAQTDLTKWEKESQEVRELKRAIFGETDVIGINQTEALEFCRSRATKR